MDPEEIKKQVLSFVQNKSENEMDLGLKSILNNKITMSFADDFCFDILVQGPGKFKIEAEDEFLNEEWTGEMNEYLTEGKKSMKDLLQKGNEIFVRICNEDEEKIDEEEGFLFSLFNSSIIKE